MAAWRNWSGELRCEPAAVAAPGSLDGLRAAVARNVKAGRRVRVAGSGHSFTPLALTEGLMLRLDRLDETLDFDPGSGLFKVEAGIVLRDLNRELDRHGVALANLGDIDRQTVGGATATGTHGTGERFGSVSSQVAALELVTADGSLIAIDESQPELLRAARVGLGSLGVVYSVTFRTVPAFTLERVDKPRPLHETLGSLDELNRGCDHFEFYVFPHTDVALCRESRRTEQPPAPESRARAYAREVVLENWVAQLFALAARHRPAAAPALARVASRGTGRSTKRDRSYAVFASQRRVRFTEMEYAVPRARAREMVERVLEVATRPELGVAFPIETRFAAAEDSFLASAAGRETCYVAVHHDRRRDWVTYFDAVEAVARELGGRPHWGKRHSLTARELAPLYPGWADFQAARARLDPEGAFANEHTDAVLGPVR